MVLQRHELNGPEKSSQDMVRMNFSFLLKIVFIKTNVNSFNTLAHFPTLNRLFYNYSIFKKSIFI